MTEPELFTAAPRVMPSGTGSRSPASSGGCCGGGAGAVLLPGLDADDDAAPPVRTL